MSDTSDKQRGLVLVHSGEGRGKSTSAYGVILRMPGRQKRVALIQFLKHESGQWGEIRAFKQLGLEPIKTGDGFIWLRAQKPTCLNLLITGRNAPPELIDNADTVTEMRKVKHAFDDGILARAGIEF